MQHRRLLAVLVAGQVLGGAATAAGIAVATILAKDLLGGEGLAGLAFAGSTFGAAAAAVPLSRRTARKGRRAALCDQQVRPFFSASGGAGSYNFTRTAWAARDERKAARRDRNPGARPSCCAAT